jgi:hypothetical protein
VVERLRVFRHVGFFCSWQRETFVTITRFLPLKGVTALGVFTIGCESKTGTTENKTQTTTTQSKDGKITSETTTSTDTLKGTAPTAGGTTTDKTAK